MQLKINMLRTDADTICANCVRAVIFFSVSKESGTPYTQDALA